MPDALYDSNGIRLLLGDSLELMQGLGPFDAIVTDPPYGLGFMGKDWDSPGGLGDFPMRRTVERSTVNTGATRQGGRQRGCVDWQKRQAKDALMFQAWTSEWASIALEACKPGAFLLAFGGTRMFHRLACGLEDAGWEIRDTIMWVYGSGFPKSHDISKAIDKAAGAEREPCGTSSGPNHARYDGERYTEKRETPFGVVQDQPVATTAPSTEAAQLWNGWGTALKPAWEPIIVAMKPLDGTFAENAKKHGVAGLNIDGSRVELDGDYKCGANGRPSQTGLGDNYDPATANQHSEQGRWPANLIHDGSDEVVENFPDAGSTNFAAMPGQRRSATNAARFFYCAKASAADRGFRPPCDLPLFGEHDPGFVNTHPTVKPIELMKYLLSLVQTPTGGVVLDPFAGSGSTLVAAKQLERHCVGIEIDPDSAAIATERLQHQ